jgi:hypothetical protein
MNAQNSKSPVAKDDFGGQKSLNLHRLATLKANNAK